MTKQSFIKGTMILLAAGMINRILGFVPRIMLPRIIGAEGIGLYQMGYPFLIVVITIVTGGIPLAIAKLVAESESKGEGERSRSILFVSLILTVTLSTLFTLFCFLAAPWITEYLLTDERVYYTFLSMSPIIIFVSISAVFRGYFQGRQNMIPTAVSSITETIVRSITMLLFSYIVLPYGVEYAAAAAMVGVVFGELAGMCILLFKYKNTDERRHLISKRSKYNRIKENHIQNLKRMLNISIPVTASKLVGSGSYFLESIMIVQSLAIAGVATKVATAQYGMLQGMVIPILLLPSALTYSLSVSLVPSLSEAAVKKDMKTIHKRLHQSLRLALVTGAPFIVIMYFLAEPLCTFLYGENTEVGKMLKMMAPAAIFIYFQAPLQATLQALNKAGTALLNTFIGASIKLTLIYVLAAKLEMGILGAIIAISINIILVTLLHLRSVMSYLNFYMEFMDFIKVGFGGIVMTIVIFIMMLQPWIHSNLAKFLLSCILSVISYLMVIVWLKLIDRYDLVRIPWFGKYFTK
ncbi:stage V sporulation protein B [Chengkuizengella axinellae]|uniref:Stage V sporulation protein B n=1 Tax=Chengkuizengella axinellae TaxID=3064388 RepID=A0ABT9ITU7_9BACL|nr:stage V sporulation protein B [Chengkuizengella sp. 2205SS18-9]MDP5272768.1 stage V sporulation protein B [Chengkuizengella sp. 2205SS18-9]